MFSLVIYGFLLQPTFINHHFGGNGRHHLSDADAAFENAPPSYFEIPHDFEKKTPNLGEQQLPSYAEAVLKHKEEEEEEEEQSCQNRQYCNSDISGSNSSSFPAEYDTEVTAHVFERDTDRPNINDEDSPGYLEEGVSSITLP